jgi:hypothetical protein
MRTESRLSHFREDFDRRDDEHWLRWIDVHDDGGTPALSTTPISTPLCPIRTSDQEIRRVVKGAAE